MPSVCSLPVLCGLSVAIFTAVACSTSAPSSSSPAEGSAVAQPPASPVQADLIVGPAFTSATLRGTVHGVTPLSEHAPDCPGVTSPNARHVIEVQRQTGLTLTARPIGTGMMDLSLALLGPDGTTLCADDGATLDPWWSGILEPGLWTLIVATDVPDPAPYDLRLEAGLQPLQAIEVGVLFPPAILDGTPPTPLVDGTYGGLSIPVDTAAATLEGSAGGPRDATNLGHPCTGWVAEMPDHVLQIQAPTELTLRVESTGDTTLLLQGPGDAQICTDDDDGLNPVIRQTLQPGTWAVFVGTWEENVQPAYRLSVSR